MPLKKKARGIYEESPGRYIVQHRRKTRRVQGTLTDARKVLADLTIEVEQSSKNGSPGRSGLCPTLSEWLSGRYADHQLRAQTDRTRRKLVSPMRYLLASDLANLRLDQIKSAEINDFIDWRMKAGMVTFATRKDGQRYRPRQEGVSSQTINKSLKLLSAALRLACDEEVIVKLPKINYLPETDARAIVPPSETEYRALIQGAEKLRTLAPHLPEVVEILGELGLRPGELFHLTWGSVDWSLGEGENRGALRVEEQTRTRMLGNERWIPKNRKFRVVPFTIRAREVLEKLYAHASPKPDDLLIPNEHGLPYMRLDEGPSKGGSAGVWPRLREVAGVEGVSMRDLRHLFAVGCLNRGIPISVVSTWMGHSSIELTVKRYGRFASEAREQWQWARLRSQPIDQVAQVPRVLHAVK